MPEIRSSRILEKIEAIWSRSGAWPDFTQAMRQSFAPGHNRGDESGRTFDANAELREVSLPGWVQLPGLCCQAAGGEAHWADSLSAAWLLCYLAADLFDHVEDQDPPDLWWAELGPGVAINSATGMCFSASYVLDELRRVPETQTASAEIIADFYQSLLVMCSGQHLDLTQPEPSLDRCWEIAAAKSGIFFALACRCGARLSTGDPSRVEAFGRFGYHLGILLQVFDDLEELRLLQEAQPPESPINFRRSLSVAYAFEVLPTEQRSRLQFELMDAAISLDAAHAAFSLIEQSGAGLYLRMEIERHRELALNALSEANPAQPAGQTLSSFLHRFSC